MYNSKPFTRQSQLLKRKAFENTERKGENAGNKHFLVFSSQCFLPFSRQISISVSASAFKVKKSKILLFGKESRHPSLYVQIYILTSKLNHSHTITPFDASKKQAF